MNLSSCVPAFTVTVSPAIAVTVPRADFDLGESGNDEPREHQDRTGNNHPSHSGSPSESRVYAEET